VHACSGPVKEKNRTPCPPVEIFFGTAGRVIGRTADFLVVMGILVFAAAMLGLIWALDRV
jgi:hypothetical protein